MTITSLRTSLRTATLTAAESSITAAKTTTTTAPTTLNTPSSLQLRTMLNASRASSDPVTVSDGSPKATTQMASSPVVDLVLKLIEIAKTAAEATGTIDWQMAGEKWKQQQGIK